MCGRFHLISEEDEREMRVILEEIENRYKDKPELSAMQTGEIFPTHIVPVLASNKKLEPAAFLMKWGFAPFQKGGRPVINARRETALDKPMFRKPLLERRCVIPASHYYEWEKQGATKVRHAIRPMGQNILYMAGLYRIEEEQALPVFTILTRPAAPDIAFIHDRMPVILFPDQREAWLRPDADVRGIMEHSQEQMNYERM